MSLLDLVRRTIGQHDLARAATRVVVAVSGGPDSVALAYLLRELHEAGELRVAGLAHFNHQLRGAADDDERAAVALARSFGWPSDVEREDVAARARRERRSIEDAARAARHAFFERARVRLDADVVALGHTRDDQAETFLLRILRGAGPRGLAAMSPRRGAIIRPLLDCRRRALAAYLDARGAAYVEDESNRDVAIPRNRVRAELVPLLEARFNPRVVDVLADAAALARDDWRWMDAVAAEVAARVVERDGLVWRLDAEALEREPAAVRRLVVWRTMTEAAMGRAVAFEHVEAALRMLDPLAQAGGMDAPGQRVEREGVQLVLRGRAAGAAGRPRSQTANLFEYSLSIPGEVHVAEAGWAVSAEPGPAGPTETAPAADADVAIVRSDVCRPPLTVRNRRPGDRFRPAGRGGRRKLQDLFVDRKVPRAARDRVPIVADAEGRIVWVAGYGLDEAFRVTDSSQAVVILRIKRLGGSA